jgi:hypothetical protein
MQPRIDPVSTIYPGTRLPDGQDERGAARVAADLDTTLRLQAEVGSQAGFESDNAQALAAARRDGLAGLIRPRFVTRVVTIPTTDALPVVVYPPLGVGWVLGGFASLPPVDSAFGALPLFAFRIEGFDEMRVLYYRASLTADHTRLGFHCSASMQLTISITAQGAFPATLIQHPTLVLQWENWRDQPMGD